jgi:hypothetical protein
MQTEQHQPDDRHILRNDEVRDEGDEEVGIEDVMLDQKNKKCHVNQSK